ncbi:deoxycytidyl transferase [Sorochytrium milnesiophthora]
MSALKRSADDIKSSNGEYNPPGFGNFGFYMLQKKQKSGRPKQGIFTGLRIHINGYTQNVGQQQLKLMILENGGEYDHYLSKTHTTHIVASNLTDTKIKEFREYKVVRPQWILDSVSAGKCLPWREYRLISLVTASQRTLSGTTSTQTSEPPRTPHLCPPQLAQSPLPTPPPQPQFLPSAAQQSPFKVPLPPSPSVQPQQPNLDDKWVQQK